MNTKPLLAALVLLAAAGVAIAQTPARPAPATAAKAGPPSGYLGQSAPDTYKILPAAPTPGTIRYQADRSTFLATRSLKDTPAGPWRSTMSQFPAR
jgi:acid phosphatase (class A)